MKPQSAALATRTAGLGDQRLSAMTPARAMALTMDLVM